MAQDRKNYMCLDCQYRWTLPGDAEKPKICPKCLSAMIAIILKRGECGGCHDCGCNHKDSKKRKD